MTLASSHPRSYLHALSGLDLSAIFKPGDGGGGGAGDLRLQHLQFALLGAGVRQESGELRLLGDLLWGWGARCWKLIRDRGVTSLERVIVKRNENF